MAVNAMKLSTQSSAYVLPELQENDVVIEVGCDQINIFN